MKRRVIQIANSTQLISLPRKWTQKYGVKKGDELEIEENDSQLIISTSKDVETEKVEIDIDNLEPMVLRVVVAMYKRGIDEIKVKFSTPSLIESVQKLIGKEAVGFEITEQGKDYCIIKHVSGELEDFEPILKRTFLLLVSMAKESLASIESGQFENLKNVAFLEEANNRFTTTCRRFLNKKGHKNFGKIGPLYYIVEEMENLADQYKYLCNYIYNLNDKKIKINKEVLNLYSQTNEMLNEFYQIFYKFKKEVLVNIAKNRKILTDHFLLALEKNSNGPERVITYHLFTIMQKIFCLVGPYLVLNYEDEGN